MGRKDHVFWDWFIALKFLGALGLMVGLNWMWGLRDDVVTAYTVETSVEAVRIEPLSFSAATIPPEESSGSMELAAAPPTGDVDLSVVRTVDERVSSPAITGGAATLKGSVLGLADDDVGEVRITRITDGGSAETTVPVAADGTWEAGGIPGGRYRVRALVPGLRASNGSAVLFMASDQIRTLDLKVTTPPQGLIFDVVATESPQVGGRSVVAFTVGRQLVDDDGRSVVSPVTATSVTADFSPVVSLLSARTVTTSETGAARFLVRCDLTGTASVTVTADGQNSVFTLPACVTPPPPEPETPAAVDTPPAVPTPSEGTDG